MLARLLVLVQAVPRLQVEDRALEVPEKSDSSPRKLWLDTTVLRSKMMGISRNAEGMSAALKEGSSQSLLQGIQC
eukprot:Skav220681  [mRNA]  locus=scaffold4902:633:3167:- [translate_table: standard]